MQACPDGHEAADDLTHCGQCGASLGGWTCENGHTNPGSFKHCGECGEARGRDVAESMKRLDSRPNRDQGEVVISRVANALIPDAEVNHRFLPQFTSLAGSRPLLGTISATSAGATKGMLDALSKKWGGLWVGGRAVLTTDDLRFEPNALNRSVHENDCSITVPLSAISSVTLQRSLVTHIIINETAYGPLKIRCRKAAEFAELVRVTADR
jgi:hypothetical protein